MRSRICILTFILLSAAALAKIGRLIEAPDFESAASCFALVAAVTGLFITRWLAEKERRRALLRSLSHEIYMNLQVLKDPKFQPQSETSVSVAVFPRFYISTLQATISSGAFANEIDKELFKLMHNWLQRAGEFNHRLDISEAQIFNNPTSCKFAEFSSKLSSGTVFVITRQSLVALSDHMILRYSKESGIERDAVLFDDSKMQTPA